MKQDIQIFDLIKKEKERQSSGLELIASENYVTDQVMEAMGTVCTNKYAEGYPESVTTEAVKSSTRSSSWPSIASASSTMLNMPTSSRTPAPKPIWLSRWLV